MTKILSQAGISLADIYDVEGSIAGVDQLLTEDVSLVHEMGGTILSERMVGTIARLTTGNILQNATWDLTLQGPPGIYRVLGVYLQMDTAGRVSVAQVSLRSAETERELPVFIWDTANGGTTSAIRIVENGGVSGIANALIQGAPQIVPTLGTGAGQQGSVGDEIIFRGVAAAFGAGTVAVIMLMHLATSRIPVGASAVGLPPPSW